MGDTVRILLVADDPRLAELAATVLERGDDRFGIETVVDAVEGLAFLADREVDCVVSDCDISESYYRFRALTEDVCSLSRNYNLCPLGWK